MYKKVFLNMMFGTPIPWLEQYMDNCAMVKGWDWMIFTPNKIKGRDNVHIIPMTLREFDQRIIKKIGVDPQNFLAGHAPNKLTSDYYPAYGLIMDDIIKGYDFWGHTNWDVVYGNLSKFVSDDYLKDCEVFSDEDHAINGVFNLYRNNDKINNLWKLLPEWKKWFTEHELFYVDETHFTEVMRKIEDKVKWKYPKHYPLHSYDRLPPHVPTPSLELKEDGSLFEMFQDIVTKRIMGKEIMYFHFSYTKKWPL